MVRLTVTESRSSGQRRGRFASVVVAGLVPVGVAVFVGCAAPQRTFQPTQDPAALDDISFLHYLATVPVAAVDEGMRAVLLVKPDAPRWRTFEGQWEELRRMGAVKSAWRLRSGQVLDKGTLAYMLRALCDLPRGLNETLAQLTGLGDRRYALKTCIHEGLMPYGLTHEPVTGGELLSALTAAERYLESKPPHNP